MTPLYRGCLIIAGLASSAAAIHAGTAARLAAAQRPRSVGAQRTAIVAGVGAQLLVLQIQHGQRHVQILRLCADVVGRADGPTSATAAATAQAARLPFLEVVVDQARAQQPTEHESRQAGAHHYIQRHKSGDGDGLHAVARTRTAIGGHFSPSHAVSKEVPVVFYAAVLLLSSLALAAVHESRVGAVMVCQAGPAAAAPAAFLSAGAAAAAPVAPAAPRPGAGLGIALLFDQGVA